MNGHLTRYGILAWSCLLVAGCLLGESFSVAQDRPPPVRKLIAETLVLCNVDREGNTSALNNLAIAQCYLGDFTAARANLLPFSPDNFFQQAIHQSCAQ